jgi:hypothetical protein
MLKCKFDSKPLVLHPSITIFHTAVEPTNFLCMLYIYRKRVEAQLQDLTQKSEKKRTEVCLLTFYFGFGCGGAVLGSQYGH